jgi:hypothetical protein
MNNNNGCNYEPQLMDMLQQRFDIELLLILDTINSGPTFRPKSLHKFSFPLHAATVGTPWPPLSGPLFDATAAVLGLLRPRRHYFGTHPTRPPRGAPGTAVDLLLSRATIAVDLLPGRTTMGSPSR